MPDDPCARVRDLVWPALDGELAEPEVGLLAAHVRGCAACRDHFAQAVRLEHLHRTGTGLGGVPAARPRRRLGTWWPAVLGGAAALLAVSLAVPWFAPAPVVPPPVTAEAVPPVPWATLDSGDWSPTPSGGIHALEPLTATLADGTRLDLAAGTDLRADPDPRRPDQGRILRLDGGSLEVQASHQDPAAPRLFRTPEAEVTVVGTRFHLLREATGTRVTVTEGRVLVAAGRDPDRSLEAGESWDVPAVAPVVRARFSGAGLPSGTGVPAPVWTSDDGTLQATRQKTQGGGPRCKRRDGRPALVLAGVQDALGLGLPRLDAAAGVTVFAVFQGAAIPGRAMTIASLRGGDQALDLILVATDRPSLIAQTEDRHPAVVALGAADAQVVAVACTWDRHGLLTLRLADLPPVTVPTRRPRDGGPWRMRLGDHAGAPTLGHQTGFTGALLHVEVVEGLVPDETLTRWLADPGRPWDAPR